MPLCITFDGASGLLESEITREKNYLEMGNLLMRCPTL